MVVCYTHSFRATHLSQTLRSLSSQSCPAQSSPPSFLLIYLEGALTLFIHRSVLIELLDHFYACSAHQSIFTEQSYFLVQSHQCPARTFHCIGRTNLWRTSSLCFVERFRFLTRKQSVDYQAKVEHNVELHCAESCHMK